MMQTLSPRSFAGGSYEYEVSPSNAKINVTNNKPQFFPSETVITETVVPVTKTVYLIRHAQSDENRRLASLCRVFTKLRLPSSEDVTASLELLNLKAQLDSDVSPVGRKQVSLLSLCVL